MLLHVMLPVTDLDRAIAFYVHALGMHLVRRKDYDASFSNAYVAFSEGDTQIELARREGVSGARDANYGHVAFDVIDIVETCARIESAGGTIVQAPSLSRGSNVVFAYVMDPDGNALELVASARNDA